LSDLTKN